MTDNMAIVIDYHPQDLAQEIDEDLELARVCNCL